MACCIAIPSFLHSSYSSQLQLTCSPQSVPHEFFTIQYESLSTGTE